MAQQYTAAQKRMLGIKDAPAQVAPAANKATTKAPATTMKASGKSMTVDSALLQQALVDLGGNIGKAGVDGKWGPDSKTAMSGVCKAHGIYYTSSERSGTSVKVNPEGAAVLIIGLNEIKKKKDVSAASLNTPGMVYTAVLQTLLNKLGFLPSQINGKNQLDGKFGPNTQSALVAASAKLNGYYKSSSAFAKLAGVTIGPAATYLKLWQAMWFGVEKASTAESAAAAQVAAKPSVITPNPAPRGTSIEKSSKSYNSKEVQNMLLSLGFSLPKYGADGKWGIESRTALQAAAQKYSFTYNSSAAFSSQKMVKIDPGDLIDRLQTALVNKKAVDAASAALDAKSKAKAKKKKAKKDIDSSKGEKEKASQAKDEADKAVQVAKEKIVKAKKAEAKAAKKAAKAADKVAAKKAKKEAAAAVIDAKKKTADAAAQADVAATTAKQAAATTRAANAATQAAAAATQQAQQVITDARSQAAQIVSQQPVYQQAEPAQAYQQAAPTYQAEAEASMPTSPGPSTETPAAEPSPVVPSSSGMSTGTMVAIGLGVVAVAAAAVIVSKKKPEPQKKLAAGMRGLDSMYRSRRRKLRLMRKLRRGRK